MGKHKNLIIFWILTAVIVLFTFTYRTMVANRELEAVKRAGSAEFAPFTVEEGIMYGYVRKLVDNQPVTPPAGSEKYTAAEQMSLGLEYFLSSAIKIRRWFIPPDAASAYEDAPRETVFMRSVLLCWITLIPVSIFWILISCRVSWSLAVAGALMNAVSIAAMARYTGEDILKGNFGFPLLAMALAAQFSFFYEQKKWKLLFLGIMVYMAAASWDATQLFLGVWGALEVGRILFGGEAKRENLRTFFVIFIALIFASAVSPYCRAHQLIASPVVLVIYPLAVLLNFRTFAWPIRALFIASLSVAWVLAAAGSGYVDNYNHFSALLQAKLQFMNVKPVNPELLTFDQRYLWTPALQSVTKSDLFMLFPVMPWVAAATMILVIITPKRNQFRYWNLLIMLIIYFFMFLLFYRFSVFAAYFLALLLPLSLSLFYRKAHRIVRALIMVLLVLIIVIEVYQRRQIRRVVSPSLVPTAALTAYMRTLPVNGEVILANMDIGGVLAGYCGASVIVQPKFELKEVRDITEEYTMLLFDPDSAKFVKWCADRKIKFFIFSRGTSDWSPRDNSPPHIYSARYMANAVNPAMSSVAIMADYSPEKIRKLVKLEVPEEFKQLNSGYTIFKIVSPDDEFLAEFNFEMAQEAKDEGDFDSARRLISESYYQNPSEASYEEYCKLFANYPEPPSLEIYLDKVR